MAKDPAQDFGAIADDYAFFEAHATEAEEDARAHRAQLARHLRAGNNVHLLDFGCGTGSFAARLLEPLGLQSLRLTLIEPVESRRREAVARLQPLAASPIQNFAALPGEAQGPFDVVLANHVFYYVPALPATLGRLLGMLGPTGFLLAAIANRDNLLIQIWITGFKLLGEELPHHTAEDFEAALLALDARYERQRVGYRLSFADTDANRMRIIRFLLAKHIDRVPREPLLALFDAHARAGRIEVEAASDHFLVRRR